MENIIILNKTLKSSLEASSKDDIFIILTLDDKRIFWLVKAILPSNQSIDEFWKLIELILPLGVYIKGIMVNNSENIAVSSVFLLNYRYKIIRKIFSDELLFISFSIDTNDEGDQQIKLVKDSMIIKNDKTKLINDYILQYDYEDNIIKELQNSYIHLQSEFEIIKEKNDNNEDKVQPLGDFLIEQLGEIVEFENLNDKEENSNDEYWTILKNKMNKLINNEIRGEKDGVKPQNLLQTLKIEFLNDLSNNINSNKNNNNILFGEFSSNIMLNYKVSLNGIFPIDQYTNTKEMLGQYLSYANQITSKLHYYNSFKVKGTTGNVLSLFHIELPVAPQYRSISFSILNHFNEDEQEEAEKNFQQQTEFYLGLLLIPFWYPNHNLSIPYLNKEKTYSPENLNYMNKEVNTGKTSNVNYYSLRTIHQTPPFSYLNLDSSNGNLIIAKGDYFYFHCNVEDQSYSTGYKVIQTYISFVFLNDNSKRKKKRFNKNTILTKISIPEMTDINQTLKKLNIGGLSNDNPDKIKYEFTMRDIFLVLTYLIGTNDFIIFKKKIKKEEVNILFSDIGNLVFPVIAQFGTGNIVTVIGYDKENQRLLIISHQYTVNNYLVKLAKEKVVKWYSVDELISKGMIEYIIAKKG